MKSAGLILLFTVIIISGLAAQSMQTGWMRSFGSEDDAYCKAVTSDKQGNIYMAGWFSGKELQLNEKILYKSNAGADNQDIFIAKFDSTGFCKWARSYGGIGADFISDILVDSRGKIYICGDFYSPELSFGQTILYNHSKIIGSLNTSDIYVAGLDETGKPLWALCGGGLYDDFAIEMALDKRENLILAANFQSYSLSLGGKSLANAASNNEGMALSDDFLLSKISQSGETIWLKQYGGRYSETITAITLDKDDNIIIAGSFSGLKLQIDDLSVSKTTEDNDIWYARLNTQGKALWLKTVSGKDEEKAADIALDAAGNIYLTGNFDSSKLDIDNHIFTNACEKGNCFNSFLSKFDPQGTLIWAKVIGGNGNDYSDEICVLSSGFVVASYSIQSNNIEVDGVRYEMQSGELSPDCLLICFDGNGSVLSTALTGGEDGDYPTSLTATGVNSFVISGVFDSPVLYQADNVMSNIDIYGSDIFLLKYRTQIKP